MNTSLSALLTLAAVPRIETETLEVTILGKETARHIHYNRQTLAQRMARLQPHRQQISPSGRYLEDGHEMSEGFEPNPGDGNFNTD